jgi:hypothetical protein
MKFPFSRDRNNPEKPGRWKVFRIRLQIFIALFIVVEIVLRIMGYKPGVADDFYYNSGDLVHDNILFGDEMGITHHRSSGRFLNDQQINKEGYFSEIEFTMEAMDSLRKRGKKVVLLVGDSYTQGCCPDSYTKSFAYRINQSDDYEVLNFGVGGTDPLHYELVVKKYLPLLKPDLVLVAVYLGNDRMAYDRTPKPFVPVCYPVKNGPWLSSEAYINLAPANTYFKSFEEACEFFFTYYSLRGKNAKWYEKIIKHSIILSRIYLHFKIQAAEKDMASKLYRSPEKPPFTYNHLKEIQRFCGTNSTPVVFAAIESPEDMTNQVNSRKEYGYFFNEIKWHLPEGIQLDDYDGLQHGNHFTASGHGKFAKFLKPLIQKALQNLP